jgi:hypothetical protein
VSCSHHATAISNLKIYRPVYASAVLCAYGCRVVFGDRKMVRWLFLLSLACLAAAATVDPHRPVRGVVQVRATKYATAAAENGLKPCQQQHSLTAICTAAFDRCRPSLDSAASYITYDTSFTFPTQASACCCCRCVQLARLAGGPR